MSTPHILFRFHKSFDICEQNIRLLRKLNPTTPIHGLYGGAGGIDALPKEFTCLFDSLFALPFEDPQYNWQHGDICIRWWHKEKGNALDFTHLCVIEWDLLFVKPLDVIYNGFKEDANYVALSGKYQKMMDEGWPWIQGRFQASFDRLLDELNKEKQIDVTALSFGIFGGCVLCRRFLDHYAQRTVRSYTNDEVRLTLYSALFDVPLIDCGFLTDKKNIMNADNIEYGQADFDKLLAQNGNAIHPVRCLIQDLEKII